ncbi:hypothetical protein TNCV_171221 [Trichonephila clavipes]|nr:hypothetical protein TNCV_171221 [Trichonephila clavipes]
MKFDMFRYLSLVTFSPCRSRVTTDIPFIHTMSGVSYPKGDRGTLSSEGLLMSHFSATRGILVMDFKILSPGQVTMITLELTSPPFQTTPPYPQEDFEPPTINIIFFLKSETNQQQTIMTTIDLWLCHELVAGESQVRVPVTLNTHHVERLLSVQSADTQRSTFCGVW